MMYILLHEQDRSQVVKHVAGYLQDSFVVYREGIKIVSIKPFECKNYFN